MFLYLAYYIGARRGEFLSLSWDDVNFSTLEIRVEAPTSKSRKERVIPMSTDLADVLRKWKEQSLPNGRLCTKNGSDPLSVVVVS